MSTCWTLTFSLISSLDNAIAFSLTKYMPFLLEEVGARFVPCMHLGVSALSSWMFQSQRAVCNQSGLIVYQRLGQSYRKELLAISLDDQLPDRSIIKKGKDDSSAKGSQRLRSEVQYQLIWYCASSG